MKVSFVHLFQIDFFHPYFERGNISGLSVKASHSTSGFFDGGRYLLKDSSAGIVVLKNNSIVETRHEKERFLFEVEVNCLDFFKVTRLPTKRGTTLYFSNVQIKGRRSGVGEWLILPINGSQFTYDWKEGMEAERFIYHSELRTLKEGGTLLVSYSVSDVNGDLVLQVDDEFSQGRLEVDMTGLPEAYYELNVHLSDGRVIGTYVYVYLQQKSGRSVSAVVEWWEGIEAQSSHDYRSTGKSNVKKVKRLGFEEMTSLWRYFILPKKKGMSSALRVKCESVNGVETEFDKGVETVTALGTKAISFTSNKPIPVREEPEGEIQLVIGSVGAEIVLPYAQPGYELEKKYGKQTVYNNIYFQI